MRTGDRSLFSEFHQKEPGIDPRVGPGKVQSEFGTYCGGKLSKSQRTVTHQSWHEGDATGQIWKNLNIRREEWL